jgi:hypothetical protein
MTSFLRKALGDAAIAKTAFTMPASVSLGLFKASPGDAGSLTNEVSAGDYARIEITSKLSAFDLTTGIATSTALIQFAVPITNWGTITHVGVVNNSSVMYFQEALPVARNVLAGSRRVSFAIGQFRITLF